MGVELPELKVGGFYVSGPHPYSGTFYFEVLGGIRALSPSTRMDHYPIRTIHSTSNITWDFINVGSAIHEFSKSLSIAERARLYIETGKK